MNGSVYMQVVLQSFSGINTSSPIDATGTASTSSAVNTITANSVTAINSGAWELIGVAEATASNVTATNFTGLSPSGYGATLIYDTTALNPGATGTVTVTGGGTAANNALAAIPFTIAPAVTSEHLRLGCHGSSDQHDRHRDIQRGGAADTYANTNTCANTYTHAWHKRHRHCSQWIGHLQHK